VLHLVSLTAEKVAQSPSWIGLKLDRNSRPYIRLYTCAPRARGLAPPESSCSIGPIIACLLHREPPRFGSRLKSWRTTGQKETALFGWQRKTSWMSTRKF